MVQELLMNYSSVAREVDRLLEGQGIRRDENLDYTCGIYENSELVATGSLFGNTVRCLAVSEEHRGEALLNSIVSHLLSVEAERGNSHVFVYTKPDTAKLIATLGFYEIAEVGKKVVFMENRKDGFSGFLHFLSEFRRPGKSAGIVMNAAPFTLGHRYLVERAAEENDTVHVFVLSEENSPIPFRMRKMLVTEGLRDIDNVLVHGSGPYMISSATFPGYFFRDKEDSIISHAKLDTELFSRIAETLGITSRYVGNEPFSTVTRLYNSVLSEQLPGHGIRCCMAERLEKAGRPVSASAVRRAIHDGRMEEVRNMLPQHVYDYLSSPECSSVLSAIMDMDAPEHY